MELFRWLPWVPLMALPAATVVAGVGFLLASVARCALASRRREALRLLAVAVAPAAIGVVGALILLHLRSHGLALFVGTPAVMGVVAGAASALLGLPLRHALLGCASSLVLASAVLLGSGEEGLICLVMSMHLAAPLALATTLLAWRLRVRSATAGAVAAVAGLVLAAAAEVARPAAPRVHAVRSELLVAAPPGRVWAHVIDFPTLPPPDAAIFAVGIAHPISASIDGAGPGAIRRCEFSTGAFVEPVTAWDPPYLLAFDVTSSPPPMRELSFREVRARHLEGSLVARHGEFRLEPLPDGGTRLLGTTWYSHGLAPEWYWRLWSDALIHRIHLRVLRHVAQLAEREHAVARLAIHLPRPPPPLASDASRR